MDFSNLDVEVSELGVDLPDIDVEVPEPDADLPNPRPGGSNCLVDRVNLVKRCQGRFRGGRGST